MNRSKMRRIVKQEGPQQSAPSFSMSILNSALHRLSNLHDLLAIAGIGGICIAATINILVFEDWNINYFQVASVQDLTIYSFYIAFVIFIFIFPLPIIFLISLEIEKFMRVSSIKIRRIFRFKLKWMRSFASAYTASFIFCTSMALFAFFISTIFGYLDIYTSNAPRLSGYHALLLLVYLLIICPLGAGFLRGPTKQIFPLLLIMFVIIYSIVWYITFVNLNASRWNGFFARDHVQFEGVALPECSKIYVLWSGERNTIVECWRDGSELEQHLYIVRNDGALIFGPIHADRAPAPPYGPYGNSPPPEDRLK